METKKVLFLPFMQIPTGHHHVADALIDELASFHQDIVCDKVDILSYSYGKMEKVVSSAYLKGIEFFPDMYDWLYRHAAYRKKTVHNRQYLYETMFIHFFKRMLDTHTPNMMFCTHALPSNMASILKQKKNLRPVTVNVYTDFFLNGVWGIRGIDYHLVPTLSVKEYLMARDVPAERIYITGIPVHPAFKPVKSNHEKREGIRILVTGGSQGVGSIKELLSSLNTGYFQYDVLCGKNELLYKELLHDNRPAVTPIPYIDNKADMNHLYNQADAVLTKPGGVTMSECLMKHKPIFMYSPLPGQEKINADELEKLGLAMSVDITDKPEEQLLHFFNDEAKRKKYEHNVALYHSQLEKRPLSELIAEMESKNH